MNHGDFLNFFDEIKIELLNQSLMINKIAESKDNYISVNNYKGIMDWMIETLYTIEEQIEFLQNRNKMKREQIEKLIIENVKLKSDLGIIK